MSYSDLVSQFLAKGGAINVIPEGATNGMTARDWKDATSDRGFSPANAVRSENAQERAMERQREESGYFSS